MELKDFADKDPGELLTYWMNHQDDPMFQTKEGKKVAQDIKDYIQRYKEVKEDMEKGRTEEIREGTVEFLVCCRDEDTMHYMSNTKLDQEQLDKFNLKEDDRVQYKIDKDGFAVILGKVHIEKTIETLS